MQDLKYKYRLYGRSKGRNKQKKDYNKIKLFIKKFEVQDLKPFNQNIILDIGSGYGENTLQLAKENKQAIIIACEKYIDGNYKLAVNIDKNSIKNIFIYSGNVHEFLDCHSENNYFKSIWILFPDPWPKKKHHKRRLINIKLFKKFYFLLKENANINIATDSKSYLREILYIVSQLKEMYEWKNQSKSAWDYYNTALPVTKYYKKAIENGRNSFFIKLRKI